MSVCRVLEVSSRSVTGSGGGREERGWRAHARGVRLVRWDGRRKGKKSERNEE